MLDEGSEAPNFLLPAVQEGEIREIALDDYIGDDIVVLAFYPADFSPTCTDEMCAIRDVDIFDIEEDVTVLAIGPDTVWSHRAFGDQYSIQFPLLSDNNGDVAKEYGVLMPQWRGHQRIPRRSVFVINDRGRIQYAWCTEDQSVLPDLGEIRDAIDAVQDDRTAADRYGKGHQHYQYGRSEFESGLAAYDREEWEAANVAFMEAVTYFDVAEDEFDSAKRFAESHAVIDRVGEARNVSTAFKQAAKWFGESAKCYETGDVEAADEYRQDAIDPHRKARAVGELPDPEALVGKGSLDDKRTE
ncbi:MAG: peroxiredoxin [Halobacteriales archaeon]|jgi:peroxiredoxin